MVEFYSAWSLSALLEEDGKDSSLSSMMANLFGDLFLIGFSPKLDSKPGWW
jgi:hypothetical protein